MSLQHFRWWIPVRPFLLGVNGRLTRPDETFGANADSVADCFATALHQIKEMIGRIDDDRAWPAVWRAKAGSSPRDAGPVAQAPARLSQRRAEHPLVTTGEEGPLPLPIGALFNRS